MRIAIIGCGYVAAHYGRTLVNYPGLLELVGAYDQRPATLHTFSQRFNCRAYASLDDVLADAQVEMVVNLTNPRSHYEITKRSLEAGKHVYSEKPLAMELSAAQELAALATSRGLELASAPCSVLSESAETLGKALRDGSIGKVRLVYANFEDGMIAPQMSPWQWQNECGEAWPAKDEFEVGCTYEHAGYVLTWLAAFFGPAKSVTSFASCQLPDKGIPVDVMAPDFTVGCIEYGDSIVARVTCGLVAPRDKSITVVGDNGTLRVHNVRDDHGRVFLRHLPSSGSMAGLERRVNHWTAPLRERFGIGAWHHECRLPFASGSPVPRTFVGKGKRVDFCRGPAEVAAAIKEKRPSRLSASLGVHVVELIHALQYPDPHTARREMTTSFPHFTATSVNPTYSRD